MSRWYFTLHLNSRTYSVYEDSKGYANTDGYATEADAIAAAITHVGKELHQITSNLHHDTQMLIDYGSERTRLEGMRNEG